LPENRHEEHRPEPLRVALMAVRSELAASATIIVEARTEQRWWRPHDALPATEWREQRLALADPALPSELHGQIESVYQTCHRLNQRINDYLAEHKERQMFPMIPTPPSVYEFLEGDEAALRAAQED
jgi:hypothetical protein